MSAARRLLAAATFAAAAATPAQAQVDWSGMMGTMAQEDAVMDAAREGRGSRTAQRPRSRARSAQSATTQRARSQCASARRKAAAGMEDPRLTQILGLCERGGY